MGSLALLLVFTMTLKLKETSCDFRINFSVLHLVCFFFFFLATVLVGSI